MEISATSDRREKGAVLLKVESQLPIPPSEAGFDQHAKSAPNRSKWNRFVLSAVVGALVVAGCARQEPGASPESGGNERGSVVRVYNGRHYGIEPVFEQFTRDTGIRIEFTTGGDAELRERIQAEGENTSADVYVAADAANLYLAAEAGLLQPLESQMLSQSVPSRYRDAAGRWYGLSKRVRAIAYAAERVKPEELSTYEALADPRWKGKLCLRPSTNTYTKSLVSGILAGLGEDRAEAVVRGWASNDPVYIDSDVELIKSVAAGRCDVAIVNHYYLARLIDEEPSLPVRIFWPDQDGRGAHVNISGAGVTTWAKNPDGARRLIEWLAGPGQEAFARANFEFPVSPEASLHPVLQSWGSFKEDEIWVGEYGKLQPQAVQIMSEAGYR